MNSRGLKMNLLFKVLLLMLQNLLGNGKITQVYVNKINSAAECDFLKDSFFQIISYLHEDANKSNYEGLNIVTCMFFHFMILKISIFFFKFK
jgi:hypothetical protein